MKLIPLALLSLAFLAAPLLAEAGSNSRLSNTMYMGNADYNNNNGSNSSFSSSVTAEELVSNNSAWENIQQRANAGRNNTHFNRITSTGSNNLNSNTSSSNGNYNYYGNNNNTGSNRYLNNPVNNNSLTNNSRYNFQYGGYTVQNQINSQNRQGVTYYNSNLSRYNFKGDPANYNGAAYQNFRGYNNFADPIVVSGPRYGNSPRYNFGYYSH